MTTLDIPAAHSVDTQATHRDRAILAAIAAGRCAVAGSALLVDGRQCADQFAAARLQAAGWLALSVADDLARRVPAELTAAGRAQVSGDD